MGVLCSGGSAPRVRLPQKQATSRAPGLRLPDCGLCRSRGPAPRSDWQQTGQARPRLQIPRCLCPERPNFNKD